MFCCIITNNQNLKKKENWKKYNDLIKNSKYGVVALGVHRRAFFDFRHDPDVCELRGRYVGRRSLARRHDRLRGGAGSAPASDVVVVEAGALARPRAIAPEPTRRLRLAGDSFAGDLVLGSAAGVVLRHAGTRGPFSSRGVPTVGARFSSVPHAPRPASVQMAKSPSAPSAPKPVVLGFV